MYDLPNIQNSVAEKWSQLNRCYILSKETQENKDAKQYYGERGRHYRQALMGKNFCQQVVLRSNQENESKYEDNKFFHGGKREGCLGSRPFS